MDRCERGRAGCGHSRSSPATRGLEDLSGLEPTGPSRIRCRAFRTTKAVLVCAPSVPLDPVQEFRQLLQGVPDGRPEMVGVEVEREMGKANGRRADEGRLVLGRWRV